MSTKGRDFWILHNLRNALLPAVLDTEYVRGCLKEPDLEDKGYVLGCLDRVLNNLARARGFLDLLGYMYKEPEVGTNVAECLKEALAATEYNRLETGIEMEILNEVSASLPGVKINKDVLTVVLGNLLLNSLYAIKDVLDKKHALKVSARYNFSIGLVVVEIVNPHRPLTGEESKMFLFGDPPNIGDDDLLWAGEAVRITGGWIRAEDSSEGMKFEINIPRFKN